MKLFKYILFSVLLLLGSVGYSQESLISNGANIIKVGNNLLTIATYDVDAQALFHRMAVQPDATRKTLINDFIVGIKSDLSISNLSDAFDALHFIAGHNQADTRLNWVNSSHTLIEVNSPTWTLDRGYTGDGASMYLDMNYNPSSQGVNLTQDNLSIGAYSRSNVDDGSYTIGNFDGAGSTDVIPRTDGNFLARAASITSTGVAVANSLGLSVVARENDNANQKTYKNGALQNTDAAASAPHINLTFYLLALHQPVGGTLHTTRQLAFSFVGSGTLINQTNLFTRVEVYLDAIGAGVVP